MNSSIDRIRNSLKGGNPLRKDIVYQETDLLVLDIIKRFSQVASLIIGYNDVIRFVRKFASDMEVFSSKYGSSIFIKVKVHNNSTEIPVDRRTEYLDKSTNPPNVFLRNKNLHQRISICGRKMDGTIEDIILIPFLFGCEWCLTSGMSEEQLHFCGEDANYIGGFIVKDGSPKYFLAHEKISHNIVMISEGLVASLKTQDDRNNSIELNIYKDKKLGTYLLRSTSFNDKVVIEVLDVIKQIYILITKHKELGNPPPHMISMCDLTSFTTYIEDLIEFTAGSLKDAVRFDFDPELRKKDKEDENYIHIIRAQGNTMKDALGVLFATVQICRAHTQGSSLNGYH